jgi:hypothetical protein
MSRTIAMVCALLLGGLGGCTLDATSLNLFSPSGEREQIIAGSVANVASSAESSLQEMGVFVNKTREGEAIRLSSSTKDGKKFGLVFTKAKGPGGEQTRMRIEWADKADTGFWLQLVEIVATAQLARGSNSPN